MKRIIPLLVLVFVFFSVNSKSIENELFKNWSHHTKPAILADGFTTVELFDSSVIIIGGTQGIIIKSTNFGKEGSWKQVIMPVGFDQDITSITFFKEENHNEGYAISANALLKTWNQGDHWVKDSSVFKCLNEAGLQISKPDDIRFIDMSSDNSAIYLLASYNDSGRVVFCKPINKEWFIFNGAPQNIFKKNIKAILKGLDHPYYYTNQTIYKSDSPDSYHTVKKVPDNYEIVQVASIPRKKKQYLYLIKDVFSDKHELNYVRSASEQVNLGKYARDINSEKRETASQTDLSLFYPIDLNPNNTKEHKGENHVSARIRVIDEHEIYLYHNELYKFFTQNPEIDENLSSYVKVTAGNGQGMNSDPVNDQLITDITKTGSGLNTRRVLITEGLNIYTARTDIYTPAASWKKPVKTNETRAYFVDSIVGYRLHESDNRGVSTLLSKTDNAGTHWYALDTLSMALRNIKDFYVLQNEAYVFVLGSHNKLYRLGINGSPSSESYTHYISNVIDFSFSAPGIGWYLTDGKEVYKSEDFGETWRKIKDLTKIKTLGDSNLDVNAIMFSDSLVGFIGADGGLIYRTDDAGIHWEKVTTGGGFDVIELIAVSKKVIYAGCTGGQLFRTYDGGIKDSWQTIPVEIDGKRRYDNFKEIKFLSKEKGYIVLEEGYLTTLDGGMNFSLHKSINNWLTNIKIP